MGLSDTIVVLDPSVTVCPSGHAVRELQTKDFQPGMDTYLLTGGRLLRLVPEAADERRERYRLEGDRVVGERLYKTEPVIGPATVRAYGSCSECAPILVRTDGRAAFGDLVTEHAVHVDYDFVVRPGEPVQVERTSGTRAELEDDLRARGLIVLRGDEPLAVAHRQAEEARARLEALGARRGRRFGW